MPSTSETTHWIRNLLFLQIAIAALTLLVGKPHTMLHGMNWPMPTPEQVAAFDFIGARGPGAPSIWSILLETAAWSFLGVMTRTEHRLARTIQRGIPVSLQTALAQILGDAAAGVSIAVALVALLWSSELKLVDIQLTLRGSGVGSVIAVSFILGFFHDRTQRVVGLVHERFFGKPQPEDRPDLGESTAAGDGGSQAESKDAPE